MYPTTYSIHHTPVSPPPPPPPVSPSGVPYLRSLIMWHCCDPKERSVTALLRSLVRLLTEPPSPEPSTHLNLEAARLFFSQKEEDTKEYRKRVRRCVQRSVDG